MSWYSKSKWKVTITPEMARERLQANTKAIEEGKHRQRPLIPSNVRQLKSAMLAGGFIHNGEPIIFTEDGYILEGQHRLTACAESGVSIESAISVVMSEINGIRTIETYGGRPRSMGIRLNLADGLKNYTTFASLAGVFATIASSSGKAPPMDIGQVRHLIGLFDGELSRVMEIASVKPRERRAWFLGTIAWACKVDNQKASVFLKNFVSMENIPRGDPTLALRVWLTNRGNLGGSAGRADQINALCSALRFHFSGEGTTRIVSTPASRDWLLSQTKSVTRKVNEIVNPPELLKLAA